MEKFKIIAITPPDFVRDETEIINSLFKAGLERLHIRKPSTLAHQVEYLIKSIDATYYNRIVLHEHHELTLKYTLGGIHLNSRNPYPPKKWSETIRQKGNENASTTDNIDQISSNANINVNIDIRPIHSNYPTISRSCHSIEELDEKKDAYDYLSLSPIYNSISKHGYSSQFTSSELKAAKKKGIIDSKVLALGGVDANNISQLKSLGFGGAMVLGFIWENNGANAVGRYKELLQSIE